MSVVGSIIVLSVLPSARAGWVEAGPERGHVLHAAVGEQRVSVATRVGVVTAGNGLDDWARDPRFPPEVRRLAHGPGDVVWAAPAGQLWRVADDAERVLFLESRTTPVDLCVVGSGAVLVALRGEEAGVLRVVDDEPVAVLEGVDPWRLAARGERVVLGTVDGQVWLSRDGGLTFDMLAEEPQGVSALGWVGDQAWVGHADGGIRVLRDGSWEDRPAIQAGYATGFAAVEGGVLISVQRLSQGHDALLLDDGSTRRELRLADGGGDHTIPDYTGVWALSGGGALAGSFRRGPLEVRATSVHPARAGFRATVTGGAAMDASGRLVLALMGTGVYVSDDQARTWQPVAGPGAPVTDSVSVVPHGAGVRVVDFEGITTLDAAGNWQRLPRNPLLRPGENQVSAASDGEDRTWSVDRTGGLYQLRGDSWHACKQRGLRLDGHGDHLLLATQGGFLRPTACDAPWEPVELDRGIRVDGRFARAAGGWVAGFSTVWRGTKAMFAIPDRGVTALAARDVEALVAMEDGQVFHCSERCDALESAPGTVQALGWLADGRVWLAELSGTLLIQGEGAALQPWSRVPNAHRVTGDLMPLERAPWDTEAGPGGGDPGPRPQPGAHGPALAPGQPPPDGRAPVTDGTVAGSGEPAKGCGCGGVGGVGGVLLAFLAALGVARRR